MIIDDPTITELNSYTGGVFQQATSGVTETGEPFWFRSGTELLIR